mmetsp:Transcript_45637/g.33373  ORF Transcript_45637/g.33373 Transcript_45637/m.33373 type:complete len:229 (+) Transcript_45637:94-780(+)
MSISLGNGNPLATAAGLFIAIMISDPFSGGHLNPSVSLTVYLVEGRFRENWKVLIAFWVAQLAGGFTGLAIAYSWAGDSMGLLIPTLNPDNSYISNFLWLLYIEFVLTLFLMISIQYVKNMGPTGDGVLGPLTVALTIFTLGNDGGPFSGGSMNPAVSTCLISFQAFIATSDEVTYMNYLVAYVLGELLASCAAAAYVRLVVFPARNLKERQRFQAEQMLINNTAMSQ